MRVTYLTHTSVSKELRGKDRTTLSDTVFIAYNLYTVFGNFTCDFGNLTSYFNLSSLLSSQVSEENKPLGGSP